MNESINSTDAIVTSIVSGKEFSISLSISATSPFVSESNSTSPLSSSTIVSSMFAVFVLSSVVSSVLFNVLLSVLSSVAFVLSSGICESYKPMSKFDQSERQEWGALSYIVWDGCWIFAIQCQFNLFNGRFEIRFLHGHICGELLLCIYIQWDIFSLNIRSSIRKGKRIKK